ncbi:MAG: hypothetical protein N5P05_001969 [Chroococcopsis gigantea SAG 12.99]|nr:hypothetical protein [Chroococcopsis gigantea SAG 12.99]
MKIARNKGYNPYVLSVAGERLIIIRDMKAKLLIKLAALATLSLTAIVPFNSVKAQSAFEEQDIDQKEVIAVARPYGNNQYDLLVIEQIPGKQQCWQENGSGPAMIDPLLLNFDFTGICRRATDSNGYSIRIDGTDYGLNYILRLVERGGELYLVGTPRSPKDSEVVVARTRGLNRGFMKLVLEPGWKFSRRAFQGKALGHYYLSGNAAEIAAAGQKLPDTTTTPSASSNFKDIANDIYRAEIDQAVALGFVAGFKEDNTFRPDTPVTREQFVSMAIEAMKTIVTVNLDAAPQKAVTQFTDVEDTRWSAKKIKWAQANGIVAGKANDEFRPTDPITRAELMAILKQMTLYIQAQQKRTPELTVTKTAANFTDISGHWAAPLVTQMSGFCGVASPLNEQGTAFAPNDPAQRNYAAAALVRTINCVKPTSK